MASADETRALRSVVHHGDVAWVSVDREAVVHHYPNGTAYLLDPSASVLWQCLDGESPLADVFADIADVAAIDIESVSRDCQPVVQSWLDAGVAVEGPAPAPATTADPTIRTWRRLVDPPNA